VQISPALPNCFPFAPEHRRTLEIRIFSWDSAKSIFHVGAHSRTASLRRVPENRFHVLPGLKPQQNQVVAKVHYLTGAPMSRTKISLRLPMWPPARQAEKPPDVMKKLRISGCVGDRPPRRCCLNNGDTLRSSLRHAEAARRGTGPPFCMEFTPSANRLCPPSPGRRSLSVESHDEILDSGFGCRQAAFLVPNTLFSTASKKCVSIMSTACKLRRENDRGRVAAEPRNRGRFCTCRFR